MDSSQRRLWKSKIRMIEKIEQEHPQDVGTVEVWDGEKKRVYYGLVTIGNDGSNGERVRVMLDGVLDVYKRQVHTLPPTIKYNKSRVYTLQSNFCGI